MLERKYTVYKHTNIINKKVYIGITKQNPIDRWRNGEGYKGQIFYRAIKKYGWNKFVHEILFTGLTKAEAELLEQCYIELLDSNKSCKGYNIALGGNLPSEITISKIKETLGIKVMNLETGKIYYSISEAIKDTGNCMTNIQNSCIKNKINLTRKGWIKLEDTKLIEINDDKKIICINNKKVFNSIKECLLYLKKDDKPSGIYKALNGEDGCKCFGKDPVTCEKLMWEKLHIYDNHIKSGTLESYLRTKFAKSKVGRKKTKIICTTTGEIFIGCKEVETKYGIHKSALIKAIDNPNKSSGRNPITNEKLKWMRYDTYLKTQLEPTKLIQKPSSNR